MKPRDLRVVRGDERYSFSAGVLVEALQSAGVPTEDAISLAQEVEAHLRESPSRRVDLNHLMRLLADGVPASASPVAASPRRSRRWGLASKRPTWWPRRWNRGSGARGSST